MSDEINDPVTKDELAAKADLFPEEPKYKKDDHTIEEWDELIRQEEERWNILGINLMQLQFTGAELFQMQCKLQTLINCAMEGDFSQKNIDLNLKMVILGTHEEIRTAIEPQVNAAKIAALKQGIQLPGHLAKPWERMDMPKGGNGGR